MKNLFNSAAAGLLSSIMMLHPGFAQEPPAPAAPPQINAPVAGPPTGAKPLKMKMTEAEQGAVFYAHVLETTDELHFSGKVTVSHEEMAKAAMQAVMDEVYEEKFFDPAAGKFKDSDVKFVEVGKEKHVQSVTLNGQKLTLEEPSIPLASYEDQSRYLQVPIEKLSSQTGLSVRHLFEQAINGALHASRDPHTIFFGQKEAESFLRQVQGEFSGIGVQIKPNATETVIVAPLEGSPAEKAGLKPGDVITKVDGKDIKGMPQDEITPLIMGQAGTDVTLTIRRGTDEFEQKITRGVVEVNPIEAHFVGNDKSTLQIHIKEFSDKTTEELIKALQKMIKVADDAGEPIRNIILDVRNDPGGKLDQAEMVSDIFIQNEKDGLKNVIVAIGKTAQEHQVFADTTIDTEIRVPNLVVVQNWGSASASEIVAGALQDAGVKVVGTRSFGKGSVQNLISLTTAGTLPTKFQQYVGFKEGGMLKVTTAAFFPGNTGLSNQGSGNIPNVKVVYNDIRDKIEAEATREADLAHSLLSAEKTRAGQTPEWVCTVKPEFAGPLSDEVAAKLPPGLIQTLNIFDEKTKDWKQTKFLDADLDAALNLINGGSPYSTMTKYEAPSNDNASKPVPQLKVPALTP